MLVRMSLEYDAQIALDAGEVSGGVLTVRFPVSAILYLRCRASTPDVLTVRHRAARRRFGGVRYPLA